MCRFNLILLNDKPGEKFLKSEGYDMFYENLSGLKAYQAGYCNCGSFVGSMIEKKGMSYESALTTLKKEKLERLYQVRDLLYQPNYQDLKESFEQQREILLKDLQPFQDKMIEYEMKQMTELEEKYQGDELQKKREELYSYLGNMSKEMEFGSEYTMKLEAYQSFLQEHNIINESTTYYLTKEEEEKARDLGGIPLSEILGSGFEEEMTIEGIEPFEFQEMELDSRVIDEAIAREENNTYQNHREEYEDYRKLFEELLECTPSLMFATIWSDAKELKLVKTVDVESFQIDDLAFLDFDDMISITK